MSGRRCASTSTSAGADSSAAWTAGTATATGETTPRALTAKRELRAQAQVRHPRGRGTLGVASDARRTVIAGAVLVIRPVVIV